MSRYSLRRPLDCPKAALIRTRFGWRYSRCCSPSCCRTCKALFSRRLVRVVLKRLCDCPELNPNVWLRLTPFEGTTLEAFRKAIRRLPEKFRRRGLDFEYLRVVHYDPPFHVNYLIRTTATLEQLRQALRPILRCLLGGVAPPGTDTSTIPPSCYYADYVRDVVAAVTYVCQDTAAGGELAPELDTGDTATTSRDFLGQSIDSLDFEARQDRIQADYEAGLDRAARGNAARREWLKRAYPPPPRDLSHRPRDSSGRPLPRKDMGPAPPPPPPEPDPDPPLDSDPDDSERDAQAEIDEFWEEVREYGFDPDAECVTESWIGLLERLGFT